MQTKCTLPPCALASVLRILVDALGVSLTGPGPPLPLLPPPRPPPAVPTHLDGGTAGAGRQRPCLLRPIFWRRRIYVQAACCPWRLVSPDHSLTVTGAGFIIPLAAVNPS